MLSVSKKKYKYQNLALMECQKMLNILYMINDLNGKHIYIYNRKICMIVQKLKSVFWYFNNVLVTVLKFSVFYYKNLFVWILIHFCLYY